MNGVSEPGIAVAVNPHAATGTAQLFLSHASEDAEAARELAGHMRAGGIRVWLDLDELKPGDNWMERLEEGLLSCDHFAVYIGRLGIVRWISREVRVALDRNAKDEHFKVIPILGPGADPQALPTFLQQHHWLDLREKEANPASIVGHVLDILGLPAKIPPTGEAPFVGLRAFDAEHAHLFFGRDREIAELLERFSNAPFLAMIGDSGSGKSSLLRAGLLPSLRSGAHAGGGAAAPVWRVTVMRPGSDPFRELANALPDLLPDLSPAEKLTLVEQCDAQLASGMNGLAQCIGALADAGQRTVLAIDQFEELFTLVHEEEVRRRFVESLLQATNVDTDRPIQIVITLRADFYPECLRYADLAHAVTAEQYAVRPIEGESLVEVIEKPAARTGVGLEVGLVEAILADLGSGGGNLPLLEHTLLQLWHRRSSEVLTHEAYESIGRVQGALEHHAEEVFSSFSAQQQAQARKLLLKLIQPGKNSGATGKRVGRQQLLPAGPQQDTASEVLRELVKQRAINVYSSGDEEEYGLAHEALLEGWQRLNHWLDEDREFLFWRQRLNTALSSWEESGGDAGTLLRGAPLAEAQRWQQQRVEDISEAAASFIDESISKETRLSWLKRSAVASLAIAAALSIAAALVARDSQQRAEQSQQLAASAVDDMLTRVGSENLKDIPQLEDVRKDLLARARLHYEKLAEQDSRNPGLQLQSAFAHTRVAEIDRLLGKKSSAAQGLQVAIQALQILVTNNPDNPAAAAALARTHNELGRLMESLGESREELLQAEQHFSRAITLQGTLRQAAPASTEYLLDYSRTYLNRGILYMDKLDNPAQARRDLTRSIELLASRPKATPDWQEKVDQHLARSHNTLANLLAAQGENDNALRHYEFAAMSFGTLHRSHSTSREYREELGKTYNNMAIAFLRDSASSGTAALQAALSRNQEAIALFTALAEPLPQLRAELANAYQTRANALLQQNRPEAATAKYRQAADLLRSVQAQLPDHRKYLFQYAVVLTDLGYNQSLRSQELAVAETLRQLAELTPRLDPEDFQQLRSYPRYKAVQAAN